MKNIEISEIKQISTDKNERETFIAQIENGTEYEVLSQSSLSYIDYLNISENIKILGEFFDVNAAVTTKEGLLCTAALGSSIETALEKTVDCDPLSIKGATIGFTKVVTLDVAKTIKSMKIKNVVSKDFSKDALEYLQKHDSINIVKIKSPLQELLGFNEYDIKVTPLGYLISEQNLSKLTKSTFKVAGKIKPSQQQAEDAIFGLKIIKHLRSCSAVVAKDLSVKAIVQGQYCYANAAERAIDIACENSKDAVLIIDGSVDTKEVINAAIQGRIGLITEAGLDLNSAKICDKYEISVIVTGIDNKRY